jgi:hypothetical protein
MRARALLLGLVIGTAAATGAQAQGSVEYAVKAAYLAKFAPFIEWPDGAFTGPAAPLTICILGNDPFGANLDKAVDGQKDGDHPMAVRRLAATDPSAACQILFIGDDQSAEAAMEMAKAHPVVTVTDSSLHAHGIVSFVLSENHVRFDIDAAAADDIGVHFSSKLLGLARNVHQKSARP